MRWAISPMEGVDSAKDTVPPATITRTERASHAPASYGASARSVGANVAIPPWRSLKIFPFARGIENKK